MEDEKSKEENKEFYDLIGTLSGVGHGHDIRIKPEDLDVEIKRTDSSHFHFNTVRVDIEIYDSPEGWEEPSNFIAELEEKTTEFVRNLCKDLYRRLEKEHDSLTSDESVKETLINNDYMFYEDGEIYD